MCVSVKHKPAGLPVIPHHFQPHDATSAGWTNNWKSRKSITLDLTALSDWRVVLMDEKQSSLKHTFKKRAYYGNNII